MPRHIVVVEDSQALNELLCDALRDAGHEAAGFLDAESLAEYPHLKDTDVLVLDIQLPGESGLQVARRLRPLMPNLGILMLTTRTSNMNRVEGYDAGADYYLPKPVSPDELVSAVDSLIRRKQQASARALDLLAPGYVLSGGSHVLAQGERWLKLSHVECMILTALAAAPGRQLEHWQILDLLSSETEQVSRSTLDVRIFRLRSKLAEFTSEKQPIVSVRGVGYRLGFELEIG